MAEAAAGRLDTVFGREKAHWSRLFWWVILEASRASEIFWNLGLGLLGASRGCSFQLSLFFLRLFWGCSGAVATSAEFYAERTIGFWFLGFPYLFRQGSCRVEFRVVRC